MNHHVPLPASIISDQLNGSIKQKIINIIPSTSFNAREDDEEETKKENSFTGHDPVCLISDKKLKTRSLGSRV